MLAYKGFNKDMTCRGFQFEEGKEYREDKAELCESGFHACENPLDCFDYYLPTESVYHEVELDDVTDERGNDSKVCGKHIKIGARLSFVDLAKRALEYVKQSHDRVNTSQGYYSVNTSEGYYSVNTSEGNRSVNTSEGNCSVNTSEGNRSVNTSQGDCSVNTSQGDCSVNTSEGDCSVNVSMGNDSRNKASAGSISVGWGRNNVCKGAIGSYMVLVERGDWDGEKYPQIGEPLLVKVDGEKIKADTWYKLKNGEIVEVKETP